LIHRLRSSAVAAILLTPLVISTVAAQATPVSHAERPVASARRAQGRFVLDGRLDDAAWAGAVPVTAFTQLDPEEGRPASERTEVYIIYDGEALYVGARLRDSAPVSRRGRCPATDSGLGIPDRLTRLHRVRRALVRGDAIAEPPHVRCDRAVVQ